MLSLPVYAISSHFGEYQYDKANLGWKGGGDIGSWSSFNYEATSTATSPGNMRPLIWDLDNDGVNEIIFQDGNSLTIARADTGSIFIVDALNMNASNNVTPSITLDSDNNGLSEIFGIWNSTLYLMEFNGSLSIRWSLILNYSVRTSPRCLNYSGLSGCYWVSYNGSTTFLTEAGLAAHGLSNYVLASGNKIGGYYDHSKFAPPIAALNKNPSAPQMIVPWNNDEDSNEGIAVIDISSTSLWSTFAGTGYIDDIIPNYLSYAYSGRVDGIAVNNAQSATKYDFQTCLAGCPNNWDPISPFCRIVCMFHLENGVYGGGYPQIYISASGSPVTGWGGLLSGYLGQANIYGYSYTGSTLSNYPIVQNNISIQSLALGESSVVSTDDLIWGHFVGLDAWQYCRFFFNYNTAETGLYCYLANSTKVFGYSAPVTNLFSGGGMGNFAQDIDNDGYDEINTGTGYININSLTNFTFVRFRSTITTSYHAISGDVNNDGNPEICGTGSSNVFCAFSTFTNQPPILNASYRTNFNTITPICAGTYLTFSAYECASSGPIAGCGYSNDNPYDIERIVSACGRTDGYVYGVYSGGNPSLSCYMNESGTYTFNVYIQDSYNNESFGQMQAYTITVVNSTVPGYCNLPPSSIIQSVNGSTGEASSSASQSSGLSQGMDVLTNGDVRVKRGIAVLIFAFVNAIIIYYSIKHKSPVSAVVYVLINFILSVLLWMLSMISILVATFIVIGSLFIAALSMLFRPGGAE